MPRYSHPAELPLNIKKDDAASLPAQIAEQVRDLVLNGTLKPGDLLPSTRALADRLEISRGSVVAAYEQLSGEGYILAGKGGTRVNDALPGTSAATGNQTREEREPSPRARPKPMPLPVRKTIDLTPGTPDTSHLATSAWRAAWRKAAAEPGKTYSATGSSELQKELAEHLRVMRSVVREPEEILVTAGARDAFRLLLSALRRQKHDRPLRIAVENPGYPSLYQIPAAFGHEILPIEVDEYGLNPALLPTENRPDIVLVAPSHQYPLGASMPVTRRLELLNWATENNAYIVEDDYDSELRYVGDPLPALAALARQNGEDRVITLGSFTKTLTPGLGLGYMLAPRELTGQIADLREVLGSPVSAIVQDAMTNFLQDGGARRHIAKMRRNYRARRDLLLETLAQEELPDWVKVLPMDGGLHVILEFTGGYASAEKEQAVVASVGEAGIKLAALGDYWAHSGATNESRSYGVIVGFGGAPERALVRGLHILAVTLR